MPGESDVEGDPKVAGSRDTGGEPADDDRDAAQSTTGSGETEKFVGRTAGADEGYEAETGAEARSDGG